MSRYTVTWLTDIVGDLASIWMGAPDRQSVAVAADRIDEELAVNADRKGGTLSEGLRSLHVSPLYVLFTLREMDRLVEIVSIRSDRPTLATAKINGAAAR
jgi:hypothetical protein